MTTFRVRLFRCDESPEDLSSGLIQATMDTRKFEYLETIRETIEMGDYDELDDYVEDIRDQVKGDPEFQELFGEIKSKKYGDVISLIDEFIYQDIQSEANKLLNEEALQNLSSLNSGLDFGLAMEVEIPEEITFEEFNEDNYSSASGQDDDF
jgi:hypothetical protein